MVARGWSPRLPAALASRQAGVEPGPPHTLREGEMVELRIVRGRLQYRNSVLVEDERIWGEWVSVPYVTAEEAGRSEKAEAGGRPCDTEEGR